VDRDTAITHLPEPYATALVLHDHGHDDAIAERFRVAPEGIPALLRLAEAKLARLLDAPT
jgi:hypothetical protein